MSRVYQRYRVRHAEDETAADKDRRHREALAALDETGAVDPADFAAGSGALLEVDDLRVHFVRRDRVVRAVDGVSFAVEHGESLGLVGESGCGKSTLGRALIRLERPSGGAARFDGEDLFGLKGAALQAYRRQAQMIFQDPFGSLNPRISAGDAIAEVLKVHHRGTRREREGRAAELLGAVGLDAAYLDRFPHEFSGGQRQRIGIARALAVGARFLIADEPVSALDVSVQVQILNLMKDLQRDLRLTYLFIAHDLAVVRYMCARVLVMYLGRIVESGASDRVYRQPLHPYTRALLAAVPDVETALRGGPRKRATIQGDAMNTGRPERGCAFAARCPFVRDVCRVEDPPLRELEPGHRAACHFAEAFQ